MIFLFAVPTFVIVMALIWMAFVEPMGALALIGRFVSGFLGFIFLMITLFGIVMLLANLAGNAGAGELILAGVIIAVPFTFALAMRWVFRRLA